MEILVSIGGVSYRLGPAHDLSIPVKPYSAAAEQPCAFGLPPAAASPICSVDTGAAVNCPRLSLVPHSNGTHTECVGHILPGTVTFADIPQAAVSMTLAVLVTVSPQHRDQCAAADGPFAPAPTAADSDAVISRAALECAVGVALSKSSLPLAASPLSGGALIVRTLPNDRTKLTRDWSGANPPYFTGAALAWVRASGVQRLVCDLPSVDRESDGGALAAHRAFWGVAVGDGASPSSSGFCSRTITELGFIDNDVADGVYVLDLHVSPILADAAPSRPLLFSLIPCE